MPFCSSDLVETLFEGAASERPEVVAVDNGVDATVVCQASIGNRSLPGLVSAPRWFPRSNGHRGGPAGGPYLTALTAAAAGAGAVIIPLPDGLTVTEWEKYLQVVTPTVVAVSSEARARELGMEQRPFQFLVCGPGGVTEQTPFGEAPPGDPLLGRWLSGRKSCPPLYLTCRTWLRTFNLPRARRAFRRGSADRRKCCGKPGSKLGFSPSV